MNDAQRQSFGKASNSIRTGKGIKRWQISRLLRIKSKTLELIERGTAEPSQRDIGRYFAYALFLNEAPSPQQALSLSFCRRYRIRVVVEANA
jgi:hypothetical protein